MSITRHLTKLDIDAVSKERGVNEFVLPQNPPKYNKFVDALNLNLITPTSGTPVRENFTGEISYTIRPNAMNQLLGSKSYFGIRFYVSRVGTNPPLVEEDNIAYSFNPCAALFKKITLTCDGYTLDDISYGANVLNSLNLMVNKSRSWLLSKGSAHGIVPSASKATTYPPIEGTTVVAVNFAADPDFSYKLGQTNHHNAFLLVDGNDAVEFKYKPDISIFQTEHPLSKGEYHLTFTVDENWRRNVCVSADPVKVLDTYYQVTMAGFEFYGAFIRPEKPVIYNGIIPLRSWQTYDLPLLGLSHSIQLSIKPTTKRMLLTFQHTLVNSELTIDATTPYPDTMALVRSCSIQFPELNITIPSGSPYYQAADGGIAQTNDRRIGRIFNDLTELISWYKENDEDCAISYRDWLHGRWPLIMFPTVFPQSDGLTHVSTCTINIEFNAITNCKLLVFGEYTHELIMEHNMPIVHI